MEYTSNLKKKDIEKLTLRLNRTNEGYSAVEVAELGSLSDTLQFRALVMDSYRYLLRKYQGKTMRGYTPCGVLLRSDVDIDVPVIESILDKDLGPHVMSADYTNIGTKRVKAGEEFYLNFPEAWLLLTRPEYACTIKFRDTDRVVILTTNKNSTNYNEVIPKVFLRIRDAAKGGSLKDYPIYIANGDETGRLVFDEDFRFQFGGLEVKNTRRNLFRKRARHDRVVGADDDVEDDLVALLESQLGL